MREKRQLVQNAAVFNGRDSRIQVHQNIVIIGNIVKEIVSGEIGQSNFDTLIDAGNRVVIPGLCDAHVHLSGGCEDMDAVETIDEQAVRSVRFARDMLLRGFTTVRDAGGITYGLKKNIDSGYLDGPRIYPSNNYISQTCGHGDKRSNRAERRIIDGIYSSGALMNGGTVIADGVSEVLRAAREQLFMGASQIKLMAGGGVSSAYDSLLTLQFG